MPDYPRHVGDYGHPVTITMSGADFTASTAAIRFSKPSGEVVSKAAVIDDENDQITYTIEDGVLDEPGTWKIQGVVTKDDDSKATHSDIVDWLVGPSLVVTP